jgi:hypothetical protein
MSALDKLFGRGNVTYHIAVAEALDSVAAAIFAEQIAFWQPKSKDGWVFRSTEQIHEYTALKRVAQEGARKTLKKAGVMEEQRRGMPARLYYRLDIEKLTNLIVGTDNQDCRNQQACERKPTDRSIEGGKSEEVESSEDTPPAQSEDEVGVVTELGGGSTVPTNKYLTDKFYDGVKEEHGVTLKPEEYRFHLGNFGRMVKQYPNLSVQEYEEVVEHMVEILPRAPKIDALKAVQDVVMGRTTGTAYKQKAPKKKTSADRTAGYEELFGPQDDLTEEERRKLEEKTRQYQEEEAKE